MNGDVQLDRVLRSGVPAGPHAVPAGDGRFSISFELAQAFVASPLGMRLTEAFPIGTLTRGQMPVLAAWQAKFAPEIRKRKPKHRKRKK